MAESSTSRGRFVKRALLTLVTCVAILFSAFGIIILIHSTEPKAQRTGATRKSEALVETMVVARGTYRPVITALGTVKPAREVHLAPRVSGQVLQVAPHFTPGGFVRRGDVLVTLDAADFRIALASRESDLHQAQALLAIEEGRRQVAEQELALMDGTLDDGNRALVLREPQVASARARVEAAQAAVDQARLDLERTRITAPFDAHILTRSANVGSQVSAGDALAHLVGIETYWVEVTIPLRDLARIRVPEAGEKGSIARVRHNASWPEGAEREGYVTSLVGTLDRQTRLARLLVTVDDPHARLDEAPRLLLGTIVDVRIEGRAVADVIRLEREYLREGRTVWCFVDNVLQIQPVQVVFEDATYAYIASGLEPGDEVVMTHLATVAPGIGLKRINPADDTSGVMAP